MVAGMLAVVGLLLTPGAGWSLGLNSQHRSLPPRSIPRRARFCSATASEPVLSDDATPGVNFDEALRMLHTRAAAAEEQQGRLRKGATPDAHLGSSNDHEETKTVYLVGVGPGDVELLTVKALRLMQSADLVLYDRLISPEVLRLVGPQASMLYVGKEAGLHTRPQEEIHELLLHFACSDKVVVRLKGGDPTVFGRGGEWTRQT